MPAWMIQPLLDWMWHPTVVSKPNHRSLYGSRFNETDCSYDNLIKKGLVDRQYDGIGIVEDLFLKEKSWEWKIFSPFFQPHARPKCDFFCVKDPNIRL